jgi:hypothetical protein
MTHAECKVHREEYWDTELTPLLHAVSHILGFAPQN